MTETIDESRMPAPAVETEREIDPAAAAAALRACLAEAEGDSRVSPVAHRRLAEMGQFLETADRWYEQMPSVPAPKIMALMRMGAKAVSFLGFARGSDGRRNGS